MRKGLRKWTFERKYYRLPSWWKNFQHRLDTPGRRSWRRWYFWASGGQWLKAEAEMLKGWGIWTHRCRHLTGGLRKGPLMWRGMWEIAQGKFHSPRYPKIQMKSQVQTSLWRIKECTSMLKVSFTQGLKRTESAFFFFFYDRISKDCRQLNQHNKTSSFSNKGSRGSGVLCHCENKQISNKRTAECIIHKISHLSLVSSFHFKKGREWNYFSRNRCLCHNITNDDIKMNFYFILPPQYLGARILQGTKINKKENTFLMCSICCDFNRCSKWILWE